MIVSSVVERWYVQVMYNNHNSPVYVDMVQDMSEKKNGVFNCTFKITDGNICDYVVTEMETYADA